MNPLLKKIVPPPLAKPLRRLPILCRAADRLHLTTSRSSAVSDGEYRRRLAAHLTTRGEAYPAPEPGVGFSRPFAGFYETDSGNYAQPLQARTCGEANPLFFLADTRYLGEALARLPGAATVAGLDAWLGAMAAETGQRAALSPLFPGLCAEPGRVAEPMKAAEQRAFQERHGTLVSAQNMNPARRSWADRKTLRARVS